MPGECFSYALSFGNYLVCCTFPRQVFAQGGILHSPPPAPRARFGCIYDQDTVRTVSALGDEKVGGKDLTYMLTPKEG